jgi:ABC-type dipeptide/oligopeptide/nickel transport system permease subunit
VSDQLREHDTVRGEAPQPAGVPDVVHHEERPSAAAWRRFRRHKAAMAGLAIIVVFAVIAVLAPYLTPHDPIQQNLRVALQTPSAEHWLGTDHLGRDMFTRLAYGARITMFIGIAAVGFGLVIGIPLGVVSGYYGRWVDMLVQRVADIMFSFPSILLALALVAVLGVGLRNVIIAVGVSMVPIFIRLVRGQVLSVREEVYVEAARALGGRDRRILSKHVLANSWAPIIVQATVSMGITILVAAGLGFLGLGVQSPTPEWGTMLGDGRQYIYSHPHMTTYPGLAIFLAVLAFNLLGDGLRDALDPRLRTVEARQ